MLPDLLAKNLDAVIVGTAVGSQSAKYGYYYSNPSNKFWATLHLVGLTPYQIPPKDYLLLLRYGIGLTDLVKKQAGMDTTLSKSLFDTEGFLEKIVKTTPKLACFNGKNAAKEFLALKKVNYGLQHQTIGPTKLFVAPSTSGAAQRWWHLNAWFEFARLVKA